MMKGGADSQPAPPKLIEQQTIDGNTLCQYNEKEIFKRIFLGKEECCIKTFQFEVKDGTIHILDYPNADAVLTLPDDKFVKQLKDVQLHWWDLMEAKQSLESMSINNSDIVNRALAQNSIITFYKCFGRNEFRNNSLKRDKILAGYPPEAKAVFDYYYDLRNKFIAHDESRYAQVFTGAILESSKQFPFVDIVSTVAVAEKYKSEEERQGLSSLYRLIVISLQWVENKIDELSDLIKEQYNGKHISEFQKFKPLTLSVPTQSEMFDKRY